MFPDFLIIDFDSTFISKESLDELAYYTLQKSKVDISVIEEIQKITDAGMNGEITFHESIDSRLQLMKANKSDVIEVSNRLKDYITPSFLRNKAFSSLNPIKVANFSLRRRGYLSVSLKRANTDINQ